MGLLDRELVKTQGVSLSQAELARFLGVNGESVRMWQLEDMPYEPRTAVGDENLYDSARAVTWLIRREVTRAAGGETAKDRLARVQADRVELEIAEKRRQLVPVNQVEPTWTRIVLAVRTQFLALPAKVAPLLEATPTAEGKRAVLSEEIDLVLRNLSRDDDRAA